METLLNQFSAYHIISYLLTGLVLVVVFGIMHSLNFDHPAFVLVGAVYAIGLTTSRLGSLILEPPLKKIGFIKYAEYAKFVAAERKDAKINGLAEQSAFYRTLATGFLALFAISMFDGQAPSAVPLKGWGETLIYAALFLIFLLAYRKQCGFVFARAEVD